MILFIFSYYYHKMYLEGTFVRTKEQVCILLLVRHKVNVNGSRAVEPSWDSSPHHIAGTKPTMIYW